MEYAEVTDAPEGCAFCHSHVGPFIALKLTFLHVPTVQGPMPVKANPHICIGNEHGQGCVAQMGALAGGVDRFELARIRERHLNEKELLQDEIDLLRVQVAATPRVEQIDGGLRVTVPVGS